MTRRHKGVFRRPIPSPLRRSARDGWTMEKVERCARPNPSGDSGMGEWSLRDAGRRKASRTIRRRASDACTNPVERANVRSPHRARGEGDVDTRLNASGTPTMAQSDPQQNLRRQLRRRSSPCGLGPIHPNSLPGLPRNGLGEPALPVVPMIFGMTL
jgi:hypothetical protein